MTFEYARDDKILLNKVYATCDKIDVYNTFIENDSSTFIDVDGFIDGEPEYIERAGTEDIYMNAVNMVTDVLQYCLDQIDSDIYNPDNHHYEENVNSLRDALQIVEQEYDLETILSLHINTFPVIFCIYLLRSMEFNFNIHRMIINDTDIWNRFYDVFGHVLDNEANPLCND